MEISLLKLYAGKEKNSYPINVAFVLAFNKCGIRVT